MACHSSRRAAAPRALRLLFAAALLAALTRTAGAGCSYTASLPASGGGAGTPPSPPGIIATPLATSGWCPPFAFTWGQAGAMCTGITVPTGGVLQFGTCALPGAACTGATALTLRDATTNASLVAVNRVTAGTSIATLSQGCVLGARCSYGEYRNLGLTPALVSIQEGCYGDSSCAGIVAWRATSTTVLSKAPAAAAPQSLAFTFVSSAAANLTQLTGTLAAPAGANVSIYGMAGANAFASRGAALVNSTVWTLLWEDVWGSAQLATVPLTTPLALTPGAMNSILVAVSPGTGTASTAFKCTHSLGLVNSTLFADPFLTVNQGGALVGLAFNASNALPMPAKTCAWAGLSLGYDVASACPAPGPPPGPPLWQGNPLGSDAVLVRSLSDLASALLDWNVTTIEVTAHIVLTGTQLTVALNPSTSARVLQLLGTNACLTADPTRPLCSLNAAGLSRVLSIGNGVTLRIGHLALTGGVSPAASAGGCVLANCTNCALTVDESVVSNCAATASGGGIAVTGGGSLTVINTVFAQNTAVRGGGVMVYNGSATVTGATFVGNVALGASTAAVFSEMDNNVTGPAGGGLGLTWTRATVSGCTFTNNSAATSDFVLVANPALAQARGGGLFVSYSMVNVTGCTLSGGAAFYGGGAYVFTSTATLSNAVLAGNVATTGAGGGMYVQDSAAVNLINTVVANNTAGGYTGGGVAALNTTLTLLQSTFSANSAPNGCGGGLGMDVGVTLSLLNGSVVSFNVARDAGGVCCNLCKSMAVVSAFLYSNTATTGAGGAVLISGSTTTMLNTTLWGNTAPAGGAISAVSCTTTLTACTLLNNTATFTHGGAIMHTAYETGRHDLVLNNCTLSGNQCEAGGGAVAAFSTRTVSLISSVFNSNSVYSSVAAGGAVFILNAQRLFMRNCVLTYNNIGITPALAANADLGYVSGVNALGVGQGGAVWLGSKGAMAASITGTWFERCSAPSGGAIYVTGQASLFVTSSTLRHTHSTDADGRGGGIMTDALAAVDVSDTLFFSCEANQGGAAWHGGNSTAIYTRVMFQENEGVSGDGMAGATMMVTDAAYVGVTASTFLDGLGTELAEGTVALLGSSASRLSINDTVFDGNFAYMGGCLYLAVPSQQQQLAMSNVTFRNSFAYVGSVLFTEAEDAAQLVCSPVPCDTWDNNVAGNYGQVVATPPRQQFIYDIPDSVRSGAPLSITIVLLDRFDQQVMDWRDTVATIDTRAALTGPLRTFYANGQATFSGLQLRGNESAAYALTFTMSGPELFGGATDTYSEAQIVAVQSCAEGETFDVAALECACADGFGLDATDNTCNPCDVDQVVPFGIGSKSCVACPPLSKNISLFECRCNAGYFGTIIGAAGVCTQCPEDTFRGDGDSPVQCAPCPATSHTFALGATSLEECRCSANTFNARTAGGSNDTFACVAVPEGGWAPQADSRLFALANYWRPDPTYSEFFPCVVGMCEKEEPGDATVEAQLGHHCREGHTGHLCAVCEPAWAYQGAYCKACSPEHRWSAWSSAKKGGLVFFGLFMLVFGTFAIFFLPLSPAVEDALKRWTTPAADKLEFMLGAVAQAARPLTSGANRNGAEPPRPLSAVPRPTSDGKQAARDDAPPKHRRTSDDPYPMRRSSHTMKLPAFVDKTHDGGGDGAGGDPPQAAPRVRVQRPSRIMALFDAVLEPARIVITFWQIVNSFSSSLYVPWPSIYYALANSLNIVSLKFLNLPSIACVQPEVPFYTVFNGVTISTAFYIVLVMVIYYFGARTPVALKDANRRRRFKTTCLQAFIAGIFLVYPQVSSTTLLIFACTELEDGTSWLMADYRVQCYTPKHKVYIGVGAFWTILLPFGLPASFLYLLYRAHVPRLAAWKRDCAWLRAIAQRALVMGVHTESHFDPDTMTLESISIGHLRLLHRLFVQDQLDAEVRLATERRRVEAAQAAAEAGQRTLAETLQPILPRLITPPRGTMAVVPVPAADGNDDTGGVVVHHAPRRFDTEARRGSTSVGEGSAHSRRRSGLQRSKSTWTEAPVPPKSRLMTMFAKVGVQLAVIAAMKNRQLRRSISTLFYSNERELLIMQLLEWAKHDTQSMVSEPREQQLSWRTLYEWETLRAEEARLSEHDAQERAAFYKYRFLFAGFAVHAWYWEVIDMMQKLFLTSIIQFIAPRTTVQVIVATMYSFFMLLFTVHVRPYRDRANNKLVTLSQVNIFLFLFTGLLLQTNPDDISHHRLLFAVVVGTLTTSIVVFSLYLFLRELSRQVLNALIDLEDDGSYSSTDSEDDFVDDDADSDYGTDEDAGALVLHGDMAGAGGGHLSSDDDNAAGLGPPPALGGWDDSGLGGDRAPGAASAGAPAAEGVVEPGSVAPDGQHSTGTPPPPKWVARLATPAEDAHT